jgi:filamentous hemagglutinin
MRLFWLGPAAAVALVPNAGCFICCVAAGTRVLTPKGERPIEELGVGDVVISIDPQTGERIAAPISAIRSARRECLSIALAGGRTLVATSDHPVFDPDADDYFPAGDWVLGKRKRLLELVDEGVQAVNVGSTSIYSGVRKVFDLTVDSPHHNFVASGIVVHNKSIDDGYYGESGITGDDSESGTTHGAGPDVPGGTPQDCAVRCDVLVACDDEHPSMDACLENCMTQRAGWAEHGTLCLEAYAANGYCLGSLSCTEYQEYAVPTTADYPCVETFSEFVNQCFFEGEGPSPECEAYCDVALSCSNPPSVDRPYCLKQCGEWFYDGAEISQNCVVTVTALVDCVAGLDCAGYAEYDAKQGEYPCKAEWEALETLCM